MRTLLLIVLTFYALNSIAQKQNNDWINQIDIKEYKVYKKTNKLTNNFLKEIEIERKNIANSNGKFSKGCTGGGKRIKLNWIAIDKNKHQIISLSFGGRAYYTKYYVIDYETGILNLRLIRVLSSNRELSFEQVVDSINESNYEWKSE